MTSAHGNKTLAATAGACLTAAALLLGGLASEKRAKIRLYEKKYSKALSALEIKNQKAMAQKTIADGEVISDISEK